MINITNLLFHLLQSYGAGIVEGILTAELIHSHWLNTVKDYCEGDTMKDICPKINDYRQKNIEWVTSMIDYYCPSKNSDPNKCTPYWHQMALYFIQIGGLEKGYEHAVALGRVPAIPKGDFYFMNMVGDLKDLVRVMGGEYSPVFDITGGSSAFIKLLPSNQDLMIAHATANSYQTMLRIIKKYNFGYHLSPHHTGLIPGQIMVFSGYPGMVHSGDDFTLMPQSGLTTSATTIVNFNDETLWNHVKPENQIVEGARATVANRLAMFGREWTELFSRMNSGTNNNQWVVINYKLFNPGDEHLPNGLFWVLEQIPGYVHAEDMTHVLGKQTYWSSYNIPYFHHINKMSNYTELVDKYGEWFDYNKTPRALIFHRNHTKVVDISTLMQLVQYNHHQEEPLSTCSHCSPQFYAQNAISARNDLKKKDAPGHGCHGGIDAKATNSKLMREGQLFAISGPTTNNNDLPAFQWSKFDDKTCLHHGQPDMWNFPPFLLDWKIENQDKK